MRMCPTRELTEGMVLGKSIYQPNGKLLLGAGFRINYDVRSKLVDRGISSVYIMEEGTEDVVPEDVISDEIRLQSATVLNEQATRIQKQLQFQNLSRERLYDIIKNGFLRDVNVTRDVRSTVEEILKDISSTGVRFMSTLSCKSKDTYLLDHSINTAILAIMIGRKFRFSQPELIDLALGSYLHDFGKIIVEKIRNASNSALADELIAEHPTFGYLLLRNNRDASPVVCQIVNQHHEHQDGSGYPIGLRGQNLPPLKNLPRESRGMIFRMAEICCVATAFDRMSMNPGAERKLSPAEAIKELIVGAGDKYNKEIVSAVHGIVPHFPVGAYIRIKSMPDRSLVGFRGVVAKVREDALDLPLIILTRDRASQQITPIALDTAKIPLIELELIM